VRKIREAHESVSKGGISLALDERIVLVEAVAQLVSFPELAGEAKIFLV
jgi:hypothetical protein